MARGLWSSAAALAKPGINRHTGLLLALYTGFTSSTEDCSTDSGTGPHAINQNLSETFTKPRHIRPADGSTAVINTFK